ncbi:MAG: hypothetical protein ACK44D_10105 [Bacteroidia bacterium]
MTTIKLIFLANSFVLLTSFTQTDFDFAKTYGQDKIVLRDGHFMGDTNSLNVFENFTKLDISKFQHSAKDNGNHHIDIWTSSSLGTCKIMKISSKIPIDTTINETEINGQKTGPQTIRATFEFVTYQFTQRHNPNKLTYISIRHEGLSEYYIDNKEFQISYVTAFVGMELIYNKTKKEILTMLTTN